MPRYYFPSWDGDRLSEDRDGVELDALDEARTLAIIALVELARDVLPPCSQRPLSQDPSA